jgi:hypothetical protein
MTFWPKEHGAYGQLAFPLMTALLISEASAATLAWVLAVVAAFIAHEPALVLCGRRGPRQRREQGRQAAVVFALTGVGAVALATLAILAAPAGERWLFVVPMVPALVVALTIVKGSEKSSLGEIAAAFAFALAAVPAAVSAGASVQAAAAIAVVFGVIFIAGTLAVRIVILRVRGGGNPAAVRATRNAVMGVSAVALAGLTVAGWRDALPWIPLAAAAPALAFAVAVAINPPRPVRLRALGWSLVALTTLAAVVLIAGFRTLT